MNKLVKRFLASSPEGKSLVILTFLTIVPFLAMLPLFFFHLLYYILHISNFLL